MKPEVDYLKNLLQGFRNALGTTTNIEELNATGLDLQRSQVRISPPFIGR